MSDQELDDHYDVADSGAAQITPIQCSALRKGDFVVIKGHPCKIVDMSTSKTGKHGHAKVHLVALDIFTNKKYEDICPSTHNMNQPKVTRTEYSAMDIDDDGYLSLMDSDGNTKEDIKLDCKEDVGSEIAAQIEAGKEIMLTVLNAMKTEKVISWKACAN